MLKNVLVMGANGQLGNELKSLRNAKHSLCAGKQFFFTDVAELDITDGESITAFCKEHDITALINCSAYTAVDKAEEEVEKADLINHIGVQNLAIVAKEENIKLVHVSTDYVFDGTGHKPYVETEQPNPKNVYGKTKLDGERAIQEIAPEGAVIIRTSWLYSSYGSNFVKTMLRLGNEREQLTVISDQVGAPTFARDLAEAIIVILDKESNNQSVELYHYANEGVCSWYDFALAIFELANIQCNVSPIETKDYPTPAARPQYSLLNKQKVKSTFSLKIPYWRDSLRDCLKALK